MPEDTERRKGKIMDRKEDILTFKKECLPEKGWVKYRKKHLTKAQRIIESFEVETTEGILICRDGYLAIDSRGFPYPIDKEEFETIYEKVI